MRTIEYTRQLTRDCRRKSKGAYRNTLRSAFPSVLSTLAKDQPLSTKYRDDPLTGTWKDFRDCHVRPDLVLIYRKPNDRVLQLVRLGSHSELGM